MNMFSSVAEFYKNGGPFMHLILLTGVVALAISLERLWVIFGASALNSGKLQNDLLRLIGKGELDRAEDLCRKIKAPAARVALAVLAEPDKRLESLNHAADAEATVVLPRLSRRIPHVNMLANTSTLLGLLGTIFGLMTAFAAVGAADPSQRSAFLAAGISQALNTTAFGLILAVPMLMVHGFLVGKVESIVEQVDEVSVLLIRATSRSAAALPIERGRGDAPAAPRSQGAMHVVAR